MRVEPLLAACLVALFMTAACAEKVEGPDLDGQDVRITFLHTSDIHSRLLPYRMQVSYTDSKLGLLQENEPFGGIARIAYIIDRERERAQRSLYLESGDIFQGAPIFNVFKGEAEFRAMGYLNPDAYCIGNHEFDLGLDNLITQMKNTISFPVVAANYYYMPDNELGSLTQPFTIVNVDGVKIGIIGVGDWSSLSSLTDIGNNLKMMPLTPEDIIQDYINVLRPTVDLVVLASHAGMRHDGEIITETCGADIVFGGHLHIVLKPPKMLKDKCGNDVLLVHSGAFAKFVGRLDIVARRDASGRLVVASHEYELFPVDATVPEEPRMSQLMEEYRLKLNQTIDLTSVFGYCPKLLTKYGYEGGDSSLGNLVAEAIRKYARVDLAFTNTLGIRANMFPGPITLDDLFNIFPFENTITLMYMSGTDLRTLFDYNAGRSSGRGCLSQLQVAGVQFDMNCNSTPPPFYFTCWDDKLWPCTQACDKKSPGYGDCLTQCEAVEYRECVLSQSNQIEDQLCLDRCLPSDMHGHSFDGIVECLLWCFPRAENIAITDCPDPMAVDDLSTCKKTPLVDTQVYEVATNDYIAMGGSGFTILKSNNTQTNTGLPLRDSVLEVIMTSDPCLDYCRDREGDADLAGCSVYQGCLEKVGEFYSQFCEKVDKTGGGKFGGKLKGCVVDTGACYKDADCYHPDLECTGGKCPACKTSAQCLINDPDGFCVDGACMTRKYTCAEGRCLRRCKAAQDCPAAFSPGELTCVAGYCQPAPAVSCLTDVECVEPFRLCFGAAPPCQFDTDCTAGTYCRGGLCIPDRTDCAADQDCAAGVPCLFGHCGGDKVTCAADKDCAPGGEEQPVGVCRGGVCSFPCGNCAADGDCPGGLACVKNLCVHVNAACEANRCRAFCDAAGDCKSGETCDAGRCRPTICGLELTAEEACLINAQWFAQQTCLNSPCVDSRVDGRIGRILPENMGDLEFGYIPNDPEELDEY